MTHQNLTTPPRITLVRTGDRRGFTLIEALLATALLGFSLIVMFGFHSQAVRANMHARKMTDCTYLAQLQMERLLSLPWTSSTTPTDLQDALGVDPTSATDPWAWLEHPSSGAQPDPVNAMNSTDEAEGRPTYYITWEVEHMDTDSTWAKLRVRCIYKDEAFNAWRGTTISSYRYRDS